MRKVYKKGLGLLFTLILSISGVSAQWSTSGSTVYYNSGNVGIGTGNPLTNVHIKNYTSGASTLLIQRKGYVGGSGGEAGAELGRILFKNDHNNNYGAMIKGVIGSNGWASHGALDFYTSSGGTYNFAMRIDDNNQIGVGTSTPRSLLHLNETTSSISTPLSIANSNGNNGDFTGIRFKSNAGSSNTKFKGGILFERTSGNGRGSLHFLTNNLDNTSNVGLDDIRLSILRNGMVGIGTKNPDELLTVKGKIHSEEVIVDLSVPGPDYVFEEDYDLPSLTEIEAFIKANKHLPEVPSAKEMEENGIVLGKMNMLLLKKIEELTLHTINQQKELNTQKENYEETITMLLKRIEALENKSE